MNADVKPRDRVDPVTVEIIRNGLISVTEEMKTNLTRTAYNMIIYEALDFTVGLFTPAGETVSIGLGLPMFTRGMSQVIHAKIARYGRDGIRQGDILITNDAYTTGSHLNHITLTMPVFEGDRLVAFTCCMAHWLDVGGSLDTVTTEIYQEGLQIPIMKLRNAGVMNEDLLEIIKLNVRLPDLAMGDLRAQITAVTTGERRFLELVGRYGHDNVANAIEAVMDATEASARARTRAIPDGVYEAESFMDDDGVTVGQRIPIKVRVEVSGDTMTIDLSEVSAQVGGYFNSGISTGISCAQVAYKCLTTPTDLPVNDGSFRSLDVIMPPGRVVSATRPAPMRWWMIFPMTVIDTIFKALSAAIPDEVIAGHHADLVTVGFYGISPRDGRFFIGATAPAGGGWGAKSSEDGVSATVCINDGDTHNSPIEHLESKFPILIEEYRLRPDSGGAGAYRGGLGVDLTVQAMSPLKIFAAVERFHCKPWGLADGLAGDGNAIVLRTSGEWQPTPPNGKFAGQRIAPGDAFRIRSGGGGGFGDPRLRPLAKVASDVAEGYVSAGCARNLYGAAIDPATGLVDEAATAAGGRLHAIHLSAETATPAPESRGRPGGSCARPGRSP